MPSNDNIVITGGNLIVDTVTNIAPAASFPLPASDLESLGFRKTQIDRLIALIERHIGEGRYPGCQIALARHGKLALYRRFGNADPYPEQGDAIRALGQHYGMTLERARCYPYRRD